MKDFIRRCFFRPYLQKYPYFILSVYDTHSSRDGKWRLAYRLTIRTSAKGTKTLFEGDDFFCSPLHGIDSDATMESLMGFLTLRPGDTDAGYFKNYTKNQLKFCEQHAEALSVCVQNEFCDENGNVIERYDKI